MAKKEIVTLEDIEQDISNSLKEYKEMSGSNYKKITIVALIVGTLFVVAYYFYVKTLQTVLYLLIAAIIIVSAVIIIKYLLHRNKRKKFCIDDYEVTTEVLSHKDEEQYKAIENRYPERKWRKYRTITIHTLYFENGKSWRIPEDNYLWCEERPMSEFAVYQSSHRGDVFIVAVKKDTGEIAMAYNTEFFEYKKRRLSYE